MLSVSEGRISWDIDLAVRRTSFAASRSAARTKHQSKYVSLSNLVASVSSRIESVP
jgi:hypothetical protein